MTGHPLDAWTRPGHDPYVDMPRGIPLDGYSIPPPDGATYRTSGGAVISGGGTDPTAVAFPGFAPSPLRTPYPNLPPPTLVGFSPYPVYPPLPAFSPYFPAYPPPPLPTWHGYPQPANYTPWYSPRPPEEQRGRQESRQEGHNWFRETAGDHHHQHHRRARSQSDARHRGTSRSPNPFPGFEPEGDSYFNHEHHGEGNWRGEVDARYEDTHRPTNWDALDRRAVPVTPKAPRPKRAVSFSAGHHHRSYSNPNPLYGGYQTTYEQHMQRQGHLNAKVGDLPYRPRSWRGDYSVKGGGMFARLGLKQESDVKEINDNQKRTLDPILQFDSANSKPSISLDLRLNPTIPASLAPALHLLTLPRNPYPITDVDLMQFATRPPTATMRLFHKRLPWYVDVTPQRRTAYITIDDVIHALFTTLTGEGPSGPSQATSTEYWCGEMGDHVESTPSASPASRGMAPLPGIINGKRAKHTAREQVSMSWRIRGRLAHYIACTDALHRGLGQEISEAEGSIVEEEELKRGVRRVDWLSIGANVDDPRAFRWIGLKKGKKGMWEIVTEL